MVKVLASLELYVVVKELQSLIGAKVSKIYQPDSHTLLLGLRKTDGTKYNLKVDSGVGVYLTSYTTDIPKLPPSFCMFLRKYLNNSELVEIVQKDLERIIELRFNTKDGARILICELFSKGNFVLCDATYNILQCAAIQTWRDRIIKTNEIYRYPPPTLNLFNLNEASFVQLLSSRPNYSLVKLLAITGLGGVYAEEVCSTLNFDKNKSVSLLSKEQVKKVYASLIKLLVKFKDLKLNPSVVFKDDTIIDAVPFKLNIYSNYVAKEAASFNQALDFFYTSETSAKIKGDAEAKVNAELERLKTIINTQSQALEDYKQTYEQNKAIADSIYSNYHQISIVYNKIKQARAAGHDWYEIHQVIENEKEQGIPEAQLVRELKPESESLILNIQNGLTIDLTKSLEENASMYYEAAKNAKSKIAGTEQIIANTQKKISELKEKRELTVQEIEQKVPKLIVYRKQEWYEKFHWFFTSSGLLAVGGRDATQNEILIKKYMEVKDLVFHTDIAGSPFFILKQGRDKATEQDKEDVAIATASYSRAWSMGLSSVDVYYVRPEQVTKEAPAGEYMSKGSFMIRGKRNYFRNTKLELAIGLDKKGRVFAAPKDVTQKYCSKYFIIRSGNEKKSDIAKKLAHALEYKDKLDDIMRALPAGSSMILTLT